MESNSSRESCAKTVGFSRRDFVKWGGAALAAGAALPGCPASDGWHHGGHHGCSNRPNIIIFITDQERFPKYWPEGWAEANLPNRRRLANNGLTFTNAFCGAAACSASRATLFTGQYPAQHGVKYILNDNVGQPTLQPPPYMPNLASMLASAGYDVQYRGKWHMSKDPSGTKAAGSEADLALYGFNGWDPPESGGDEQPWNFGGGDADYDGHYAEQAADFLKNVDRRSGQPFALIVSLTNPHDICGYPNYWDWENESDTPPYEGSNNYGKCAPECFEQGISLPPDDTRTEDLTTNYKPPVQAQCLTLLENQIGSVDDEEVQMNYVNFYAYLHKITDGHIGTVLDALESNRGLADDTVIVRVADHGDVGLAHGLLRQKLWNAYEETIHIPFVISNPKLFPSAVQSDALVSLIDIMPTLGSWVDAPFLENYAFKGCDLMPIIQDAANRRANPTTTVQDSILFTSDEEPPTSAVNLVLEPYHVRCIREAQYKFVMYFDDEGVAVSQYELYDLVNDPMELHNMARPDSPYYDEAKTEEMKEKLLAKMDANDVDYV